MKTIGIRFIPQGEQRYVTSGDYWETEDSIEIRVSDTGNPVYNIAVAIHELYEKVLKDRAGIRDAEVDAFDMNNPQLDDPGLSPDAPYHVQHMQADVLERAVIALAGEDWIEYEKTLEEL